MPGRRLNVAGHFLACRSSMSVTVELIYVPPRGCCAKECERLRETARAMLGDALIWRDLSVLEHFDYAASLGVLTLPAVAINGRVVFSSLPTPEQLRRALERPVARELSRV
jgi:thioredoxin 1